MTSQNQQGKDLHKIVEFVLLIVKFIVVPSKKRLLSMRYPKDKVRFQVAFKTQITVRHFPLKKKIPNLTSLKMKHSQSQTYPFTNCCG